MNWQDVPEIIDLETDGEVWATLELDERTRRVFAGLCARWHQSLQTVVVRTLMRKARRVDA